jgi:hypothetical protein
VDWLMNEAGDVATVQEVKSDIGPNTQLINCLANWNQADPEAVVPASKAMGIGLYGFTKPTEQSLLPSIDLFLSRPVHEFKGDEKNIATFARVFNGHSVNYVKEVD